jgi:hypothetical protein
MREAAALTFDIRKVGEDEHSQFRSSHLAAISRKKQLSA